VELARRPRLHRRAGPGGEGAERGDYTGENRCFTGELAVKHRFSPHDLVVGLGRIFRKQQQNNRRQSALLEKK